MKKSYIYFLAPVVLTAIFAVFYVRYASGYEERLAAMENKKKEERAEKLRLEASARDKAVADAIAQTEKRKKEKAEREAREAKERDAREEAVQARGKAREEERKFEDQVKRLTKEVKENQEEITKIEQDKKDLIEDQKFLRDFVKQAEANSQALGGVLEKIEAADKARADAERLAKKSTSS